MPCFRLTPLSFASPCNSAQPFRCASFTQPGDSIHQSTTCQTPASSNTPTGVADSITDLSVDCGCGGAPGENGSCPLDANADVTSSLFPESDSCLTWESSDRVYRSSTLLIYSSGETSNDDGEVPLVDWVRIYSYDYACTCSVYLVSLPPPPPQQQPSTPPSSWRPSRVPRPPRCARGLRHFRFGSLHPCRTTISTFW